MSDTAHGLCGVGGVPGRGHRGGFTLIEVLFTLSLVGVLAALSVGPIGRLRDSFSLRGARAGTEALLSRARAEAVRRGRYAVVTIDSGGDQLAVQVDTSAAGDGSGVVRLSALNLRREYGVDVSSDRTALCFDHRGLGVLRTGCPRRGGEVVLRLGSDFDTLRLTSLGRVRP